jgi:hypothetical protein
MVVNLAFLTSRYDYLFEPTQFEVLFSFLDVDLASLEEQTTFALSRINGTNFQLTMDILLHYWQQKPGEISNSLKKGCHKGNTIYYLVHVSDENVVLNTELIHLESFLGHIVYDRHDTTANWLMNESEIRIPRYTFRPPYVREWIKEQQEEDEFPMISGNDTKIMLGSPLLATETYFLPGADWEQFLL